jgi:hypothetical protein
MTMVRVLTWDLFELQDHPPTLSNRNVDLLDPLSLPPMNPDKGKFDSLDSI